MVEALTWAGITFCLSQSAMFSGLNLAYFSLGRLDLEIEAETNPKAQRVLALRRDSNRLLTTILWGNVAINVLLTLLTESAMAGVAAFLVSTFLITLFGEIAPQAYFSRNPLQTASFLAPALRLYRFLLYPVAMPTARMLDWWLGKETPNYLRERALRRLLLRHALADSTDVDVVESRGAVNFLDLDDRSIASVAHPLAPSSVIELPVEVDLPRFPPISGSEDPFLRRLGASGEKWVVLTDPDGVPRLAVDADAFIRGALFDERFDPYAYCHRPIIVDDRRRSVGYAIGTIARGEKPADGAFERDVVLVWGESPLILTGGDILRRLLAGI